MRVVKVVPVSLSIPVPVYDIEVPENSNFLLHDGCFVHNSKDVADAVCGAFYSMVTRRASWVVHDTDQNIQSERPSLGERVSLGARR